jgi:unsaturated chondroitin disaccharide hydrolase
MPYDWQDAIDYSIRIIIHNMETLEDFPESCSGQTWSLIQRDRGARGHWVDGFWTGLLWLAYAHTGEARFERAARDWTERLAWLKESVATHDLGFIFYLSHVLGGRLTGDESLYDNAVEAAGTLIKRFNPRGEYLQAWGTPDGTPTDRGRINIDVMMNLALLYWASEHTGDLRFATVATQHARTTRLTLMRSDGSTAQVGDFDAETGVWLRRETHQGFCHDTCWSRGQAWGLYGFTTCYGHTGIESFLWTARVMAEYTIHNLPEDLVPFWDYGSPDIPNTYRDSSAAAATATGLLDLAACEPDPERAVRWTDWAQRITDSLWRNYSSRGTDVPALLLHGSRSVPHGFMDHALIYGDYYFFEALTKLARPDIAARAFPEPVSLAIV